MKKLLIPIFFLVATTSALAQLTMSDGNKKLVTTMAIIENLYVDKVDDKKLTEDAIRSLLEKLDPHSVYISQEEVKEMNEPLEGNFDGIGVMFNMMTDTLYIIEPVVGGPSEKVGIRAGDRIIYANDVLISGAKKTTKEIMSLLRGPKGTSVNVSILRKGEKDLLKFNITRGKIPIYSLDAAYMIDNTVAYVKLSRFGATTFDEFKEACKKLKAQGMQDLILDLQYNGGGYLSAAIDLANEFLPKEKLIVYTEGANQTRQVSAATSKGDFEKGKLVILINQSSASASEIVSGAIQDWDRGLVIGRRSFGKGLVQRQLPLPDQSMIRLTVARYYTPTGRCIQKPYTSGDMDTYNMDLADRYNKGEMMHADSIHFPDSLKYQTLVNKRIVYGGGGIMPDYYVPMDTTIYPAYYRNIWNKDIAIKIAFSQVDNNRKEILAAYPTPQQYIDKYEVSDEIMKKLIDAGEVEKVKFDQAEYDKSKNLLATQIKAHIARDIYNAETYIKIMNTQNEIFVKGYDIIRNKAQYESLLKGK